MHSYANVMKTSTAELNALQSEFQRVYGPNLEDLPNKNNTLFIFVQQGYENVEVMMRYIIDLGIKKSHIFMTTKPHTSCAAMREQFRNQVGHYVDFQWSEDRTWSQWVQGQKLGYTQKHETTNQLLLDNVLSFLDNYQGQGIKNILVLDEGGRFLSLAAGALKEWRDVNNKSRQIIAVEHTISGTRNFDCSSLDFPYILMADCYLKSQIEARYVAESIIESAKEEIDGLVDGSAIFGVIGCGHIGQHLIEFLSVAYPDSTVLVNDIKSTLLTQDTIDTKNLLNVHRKHSNLEVFKDASIIFGCTGVDITAGLTRRQIAGSTRYTTLFSASSGDREFKSLLFGNRNYRLSSRDDICDIVMQVNEYLSYSSLPFFCQKIKIKNAGFPINFSKNRTYGIAPNKVGITLAMKYAAVAQSLELFSMFKLAQDNPLPEGRVWPWLTRYMMLDPRFQQIILEGHAYAQDKPLGAILQKSYGDPPTTRSHITGEIVFTELLSNCYRDRNKIPLMFYGEPLPMDRAFIRLVIKPHSVSHNLDEGDFPLQQLFEPGNNGQPTRHIVIEGEPGVGKTTLSSFIGFACFNRVINDQEYIEAPAERIDDAVPTSPLLREVNQWASLFKGVITLRLRELNNFDYQHDYDRTNHRYSKAQYKLAEFILSQHCLLNKDSLGDSLEERVERLLTWLYSADIKAREHYLLILDGYDELLPGMYKDDLVNGHDVLRALLEYPYWVLTSRPKQIDDELLRGASCDRHLVLDGFSRDDVEDYVKTVVPMLSARTYEGLEEVKSQEEVDVNVKVNNLLDFLVQRPGLKQLARVPICCQLLCYLWNEAQERLESIEPLTPALLYKEMVLLLAARARERQAGIDQSNISQDQMRHNALASYYRDAFHALSTLSFEKQQGDRNLQLTVNEAELESLSLKVETRENVCKSLHLLRPIYAIAARSEGFSTDQPEVYEFVHLSFQEFLAANELVKQLASDNQELHEGAIHFVRQNKYDQHYRNMFGFASSIVMEPDCNLLWCGDDLSRERAKMAFWQGIRPDISEELSDDSRQQLDNELENQPVHVELLMDLWLQMGDKLEHLPDRMDGRLDYEHLDASLLKIMNKLFSFTEASSEEVVSSEEAVLIEKWGNLSTMAKENHLPNVVQFCVEKYLEDKEVIVENKVCMHAFCSGGVLDSFYVEEILGLYDDGRTRIRSNALRIINELSAKVMPRRLVHFFMKRLEQGDEQYILEVADLPKLLANVYQYRQTFFSFLRSDHLNVRLTAWNALAMLGSEFVKDKRDFLNTLSDCINGCVIHSKVNALRFLGKLSPDVINSDTVLLNALHHGLHHEEFDVFAATLHSLVELGSNFVIEHSNLKEWLIAELQGNDPNRASSIRDALVKFGADFISENSDFRVAFLTYRNDDFDVRVEIFHKLVELGDDFVLQNQDVQGFLIAPLRAVSRERIQNCLNDLANFDPRSQVVLRCQSIKRAVVRSLCDFIFLKSGSQIVLFSGVCWLILLVLILSLIMKYTNLDVLNKFQAWLLTGCIVESDADAAASGSFLAKTFLTVLSIPAYLYFAPALIPIGAGLGWIIFSNPSGDAMPAGSVPNDQLIICRKDDMNEKIVETLAKVGLEVDYDIMNTLDWFMGHAGTIQNIACSIFLIMFVHRLYKTLKSYIYTPADFSSQSFENWGGANAISNKLFMWLVPYLLGCTSYFHRFIVSTYISSFCNHYQVSSNDFKAILKFSVSDGAVNVSEHIHEALEYFKNNTSGRSQERGRSDSSQIAQGRFYAHTLDEGVDEEGIGLENQHNGDDDNIEFVLNNR